MTGIFVTGTDTDVGKSLITAGLTRLLRNKGMDCVAIKPVETGCKIKQGELFPEDGYLLWRASEAMISLDNVTPFRFSFPAAPYRSAAVQDSRLRVSDIVEHIKTVQDSHDLTIVEGAGGLFVPIEEKRTFLDLMAELNFPVVLVARTKLGTINHTLLSLEALERRNLNILAVILSKSEINEGPEEGFIAGDIKRLTNNIPIIRFPFLSQKMKDDPEEIANIMDKLWGEGIFIQRILNQPDQVEND
jgi:dethiobiotin synthase